MMTCDACGQSVEEGRFCTQCGARALTPEQTDRAGVIDAVPALAGAAALGGASVRASEARYPLFAQPETSHPSPGSLAETAVRPMAGLVATDTTRPDARGQGVRAGDLVTRLGAEVKRYLAGSDPSWISVLTLGVGGMLVALVLGIVLLVH
jgi:hypothetical protein